MSVFAVLFRRCLVACVAGLSVMVSAWAAGPEYRLGAGDAIRVHVFQNPDLTLDARVSENGTISYPLVGSLSLGGLSLSEAEQRIADALRVGNFLKSPQVTLNVLQVRGSQVAVLGQVARPGRFTLETSNVRASEMLAAAGGVTASASGGRWWPGGPLLHCCSAACGGRPFASAAERAKKSRRQGSNFLYPWAQSWAGGGLF